MTFEELLDYLRGLVGKDVSVSLTMPVAGHEDDVPLTTASGQVLDVLRGPTVNVTGPNWFFRLGPAGADLPSSVVVLYPDRFEAADAHAAPGAPERRATSGTTWELTIRHAGTVISVTAFLV